MGLKAIKNTWYQAGWVDELVQGELLSRTINNIALVFFRDSEGKPNALINRCPHKFAPLSAGCVKDNSVVCGYHGLAFGGDGACTDNPHGPIPDRLKVVSYPVVERHKALWVWLGELDKADPNKIPDLSFIDDVPEHTLVKGYMYTECDYQLLTDNILDLSHADYLHPTTLGGMMVGAKTALGWTDDKLRVSWLAESCIPPAVFVPMIGEGNKADMEIAVDWLPPAVMVLTNYAVPAGRPVAEDDLARTLHNMVPEQQGKTHYFYCLTRRFHLESEELTEALRETTQQAFRDEDKPMLEKQQAVIGNTELMDLSPVLLAIDAAGVQARRRLEKLMAEETIS